MANTQVATGSFAYLWLLIALPLIGALVLLLGGNRTNSFGPLLAVLMPATSFGFAVYLWLQMLGLPKELRSQNLVLFEWINIGSFQVPFGFQLDPLSMSFVLLITGVGSLIHIYSLGYMDHDPGKRRFFGYLNLFVAAMLLLVLADNYLLLYVGWEGVGLASYLLIGYYQHKPSAAAAAKKAFVVNRVGDVGLSLAIMLMFVAFHTVTFAGISEKAEQGSATVLFLIGIFLLIGAAGKSAQVPLQSWLLDAMEGPTPVSALIHAATMVTAGVYLIVRSNSIYDLSVAAQNAVILVGAVTLLAGAAIGMAKDDIKKALAASTMSQIGYMVLAAGLGPIGYVYAIMHLLTHGFFKAGMFLGAGSVMHAMNDEVDMRKYGALRGIMMITFGTFFVGYLAILGVPPFAGFYSKDLIIEAAFDRSIIAGVATLLGAGITAFYMSRLILMTFFSNKRWEDDAHPHESGLTMTIPMVVLAIGSVSSGFLLTYNDALKSWLAPVTGYQTPEPPIAIPVLIAITLATVLLGVLVAVKLYLKEAARVAPTDVSIFTKAARKDLYGDAINEAVFMRGGQQVVNATTAVDNSVVEGSVNFIGRITLGLSSLVRATQTGYTRNYALAMLIGVALLLLLAAI
ncbi:MAG: NADH-quinone oxidoreductase subunit L, partial [Actinomycetota bacterium]|nr:NADH-quinone oxidoreductase subunit L [Actinomycetota bacterium]